MKPIVKRTLAFVMAATLSLGNLTLAHAAEWNSSQVYNNGDQITYNGKTYEAKWWTKNEVPGSSMWGSWKELDDPAEAGKIPQWKAAKVYGKGDQVIYKNAVYEAKWWSQNQKPDTSYDWKKVKDVDETTPTSPVPTETAPAPTETVPVPTETVPVPTETTPVPTETTPAPTETTPVPTETTPAPTETVPVPTETTPAPTETTPVPTETTPAPTETVPVPTETTPAPTETVPVPTETIPIPGGELRQTSNVNGVKYPAHYWDRKIVGYFPNYAINSEAHSYFSIADLQWDKLTHVQYAFVIADENTYEMKPIDAYNDTENRFEDRQFFHKGKEIKMDPTLGYYGQFNLMHTLHEMYPDVTVLASTGGWAASRGLWKVLDSETNMRKFADSAVAFCRKYGFDGIDIDFEYPSETSQSGNPADFDLSESRRKGISERYGRLIEILRETFDNAAKKDGTYYWVTSAVTGSSWVLGGQTNATYLDNLDFVSVMSYDYHGGWNQFVENQANIYADPADTETKAMAVPTLGFDWSHKFYRGAVQSEKILMGIPFYTRGWDNVNGGVNGLHGSSKTPAVGNHNIWHDLDANGNEIPAGANPLWHVLNLMHQDSNYKKYWDPVGCVPHVWNEKTRTFLTFEDEQSIQERINYIGENNLGGCLIWVMHGDYDYDAKQDKYVVGDTLTTMLSDQLGKMAPARVTSDIDLRAPVLDFDVNFGGKYDHPNFTYEITVTNHSGQNFDKWNVSFDIPNSAVYGSSWGGQASTKPSKNPGFTTVTLTPGWQKLPNGGSVTLQGMIKLNFSAVKNFKLNGCAMRSEVEAEIARLSR